MSGKLDVLRRARFDEHVGESAEWWVAVQPSTERDGQLLDALSTAPLAEATVAAALRLDERLASQVSRKMMKVNRAWSAFDAQKLSLGHRILENAASVLRTRASHILTHMRSGVGLGLPASFDVAAISSAFCACAELTRTRLYAPSSDAEKDREGGRWLVSSDAVMASPGFGAASKSRGRTEAVDAGSEEVHKSLLYVSENLICALYYVAEAMTVEELSRNASSFRSVLGVCEAFDAHSFICETGRRLGKLLG
jgi:hypothetical protein